MCYHAINRGNVRAEVFHKEDDYAAFIRLVEEARERLPMRALAYCLMPNHFHMVLWPHGDGDLSRWMQWLLTAQVRYEGNWLRWVNRPQTPAEENVPFSGPFSPFPGLFRAASRRALLAYCPRADTST